LGLFGENLLASRLVSRFRRQIEWDASGLDEGNEPETGRLLGRNHRLGLRFG
jgi:hypothetical protein